MSTRYGARALESAVKRIVNAPRGARHATIFKESCSIGELVAGAEIDNEQVARAALVSAGRTSGLNSFDVERQVNNGLARGAKNPRIAPNNLYQPQNRSEVQIAIQEWYESLAQYKLKPTTMKLAKALAERAIRRGSNVFDGSYRQIALDAGMGMKTVPRQAVKIPGLTFTNGSKVHGHPTVWTIAIKPTDGTVNTPLTTGDANKLCQLRLDASDNSLASQKHEIWAARQSAWGVFHAMGTDMDDMTVNYLMEQTGLSRTAVANALTYMASYGLVERLDRFTWRRTAKESVQADEVKTNVVERRHRRYKEEQVLHRAYVKVQSVLRKFAFDARKSGEQPKLKAVKNSSGWHLADLNLMKLVFDGQTGEFSPSGISFSY